MAQDAAGPVVLRDANAFEFGRPFVISYMTTSSAGTPYFEYHEAELDLTLTGDAVTRTLTPAGELVTVTLEQLPAGFQRRFTLVVPHIRIAPATSVEFSTFGFETVEHSAADVPPVQAGVRQHYRVHQLRGTAIEGDF